MLGAANGNGNRDYISYGMKRVMILVWCCMGLSATLYAQTPAAEGDPQALFDFWVGTWDLQWEAPDGTVEHGTNKIEKILGGKVLLESFEALSGQFQGYKGKSLSVWDSREQRWKQTWVDNEGTYLDFTGRTEGDKRIFSREFHNSEGKRIRQRMVFYHISWDSLDWDWETSADGGESWELRWRIHYTRAE